MLRSQINALVENVRLEIASIQDEICASRDAAQASQKAHEEIPVRLAEISVGLEKLRVPSREKVEADAFQRKAHRQQVLLTWGTWLAFIAAAIYAYCKTDVHATAEPRNHGSSGQPGNPMKWRWERQLVELLVAWGKNEHKFVHCLLSTHRQIQLPHIVGSRTGGGSAVTPTSRETQGFSVLTSLFERAFQIRPWK
jgi:hypothetical protein